MADWYKKRKCCKVLKESDPEIFEHKYAEYADKAQDPIITFSDGYFIAVITWEEILIEDEPRTIRDEYHEQGIRYVCSQCPYLEMDGDKRRKYHPCKHHELGTAHEDHEACEYFYKLLQQGKIVPRF
jgi:hypothetical protein